MKILLLNPPIYDFTAYDFWMKPYGLLKVAGYLSVKDVKLYFYDFLDRNKMNTKSDIYGRGKFIYKKVKKPEVFRSIRRYYKRYGLDNTEFINLVKKINPDYVLISTGMTYWYPGVREVIEIVKKYSNSSKIILGGIYATLLKEHALNLGADYVIEGSDLKKLFDILSIEPNFNSIPRWDFYERLSYGVIRLTRGCIYNCSYCASRIFYKNFEREDFENVIKCMEYFYKNGIRDIVFYDDALLINFWDNLYVFLKYVEERFGKFFRFHTPNALHARYINEEIAKILVDMNFESIYLGFENVRDEWRSITGEKVKRDEMEFAIKCLKESGAKNVTVYIMLGHPLQRIEDVYNSIDYISGLNVNISLAEYSPVPKTKDFKLAMRIANLDENEPLYQNKTAYPIFLWGEEEVNRIKLYRKRVVRKIMA